MQLNLLKNLFGSKIKYNNLLAGLHNYNYVYIQQKSYLVLAK